MEFTQKGALRLRKAFDRHSWSKQEIEQLMQLADQFQKKWNAISEYFPNLTQNQVKNKYYYLLQHPLERREFNVYNFIVFDDQQIKNFDFQNLNYI